MSYSVVVAAPAAGTPTGTVTVSDGTVSCTATAAAGSCVLTPRHIGCSQNFDRNVYAE
ncbi:MAG: hypothetical protein MZV70_01065 [Desulfobacterales bacterium]|nr:hypothetical protein [Desulfobacterales bacterium]